MKLKPGDLIVQTYEDGWLWVPSDDDWYDAGSVDTRCGDIVIVLEVNHEISKSGVDCVKIVAVVEGKILYSETSSESWTSCWKLATQE